MMKNILVYLLIYEILIQNFSISSITLETGILLIFFELKSFEDIENRFGFSGVNFVESFGPKSLINGQYPVDNI